MLAGQASMKPWNSRVSQFPKLALSPHYVTDNCEVMFIVNGSGFSKQTSLLLKTLLKRSSMSEWENMKTQMS